MLGPADIRAWLEDEHEDALSEHAEVRPPAMTADEATATPSSRPHTASSRPLVPPILADIAAWQRRWFGRRF